MSTVRSRLPAIRSGGDESAYRTTAKFVLSSALGTTAWILVLAAIPSESSSGSFLGEGTAETMLAASVLAAVVLSVLPAVYIQRTAPSEANDRYQKLGIHFAMFASVNIIITASFLVAEAISVYHPEITPSLGGVTHPLGAVITLTIFSSIFLPGPYFGTIVGRRWSK